MYRIYFCKIFFALEFLYLFTANELKKRLAVKMTETVPTSPSTSTAQLFRKKHERVQTIPVPTDTIIAFGDDGKNEIWRSGTNKWTEWEKGRDCGYWYACVKAHSNIYIIGGRRGVEDSTETDIYDISKEQWSKGPQLKVARLDNQLFRQFLYLKSGRSCKKACMYIIGKTNNQF